jgi:mannosyltransferase
MGVAAIPAIYILGKTLFGTKVGRTAAILCCFHVFLIQYSQEARAYSLLVLLAVLSSLSFVRGLQGGALKDWAAYILLSSLMVYAQVFGSLVLVSQWLSAILVRKKIPWQRFLGSAILIGVTVAPLPYCLLFVSDRTQLAWLSKPTGGDITRFILQMTGEGGFPLVVMYATLLAIALASAFKGGPFSNSDERWNFVLLMSWLFLPAVVLWLISLRRPVFHARFLIICVPPLLLMGSYALAWIRSRTLFAAALAVLLLFSLDGDLDYFRSRSDIAQTDDWRDATRYILSQTHAEDAIVLTYSEEKLAFDYYRRQFGMTEFAVHEFPEGSNYELLTRRPWRPERPLLDRIAQSYTRVWVVSAFQPDAASRSAVEQISRHLDLQKVQNFGFVRTELFAGPAQAKSTE